MTPTMSACATSCAKSGASKATGAVARVTWTWYTTPDGVTGLAGTLTAAPASDARSGFEWTGEWTITYETFRDLGMAFGAALVLIYILLVWEFRNFIHPAIIMSPIPLTLVGIVPGHWFFGASFTATSMIGFIALAGIIVRNSILLVDFISQQVREGGHAQHAVIDSAVVRAKPIALTALAAMAGAVFILDDPIFSGLAVSRSFGLFVSTVLTLVVIPVVYYGVMRKRVEWIRTATG